MVEESKRVAENPIVECIPRLIIPKPVTGFSYMDGLRQQHNQYLAAVFGTQQVIELDKSTVQYNLLRAKLDRLLRLEGYLNAGGHINKDALQDSIPGIFEALFEFLRCLEAHLARLHACIEKDQRWLNSFWADAWFFLRGARYVKKASATKNKLQKILITELQTLAEKALFFIESHPNISQENFYRLHLILLKAKNPTWQRYLNDPYNFGSIASQPSIFLSRNTRRELFYRTVTLDRGIAGKIKALAINEVSLPQVVYTQLKEIEALLLREIAWNQHKTHQLSHFWQRSTRSLLQARRAQCEAQYQIILNKKILWHLMFAPKKLLSPLELDSWCRGMPSHVATHMHVVHATLQQPGYYSHEIAVDLACSVDFLASYLKLPDAESYKQTILQQYHAQVRYYDKKDIIQFLSQSTHWEPDNTAKSQLLLDDMLKVTPHQKADWAASYLLLAEELMSAMLMHGANNNMLIQRLFQRLAALPALLEVQEQHRLERLNALVTFCKKMPKNHKPLLVHFAQLLRDQPDTYKILLVINRAYLQTEEMLSQSPPSAEYLQQKKILVGVLCRAFVLLPKDQQHKVGSIQMILHLASEYPALQHLLTQSAQIACPKNLGMFKIPSQKTPVSKPVAAARPAYQ